MFFVEAGAENPLAAGCVSAAISMLYLESADAAIPVGAFAGYAVCSWLRYLFGGSGELDGWIVRCNVGVMLMLHRAFFFGRNCR